MANPAIDTDFMIATQAAGVGALVTLRSLGVPNPHPVYNPGVSVIKLGDRSARTLGAPSLVWEWGFVSNTQRDTLRTYCPGASAPVYIVSPTTEKISTVQNASQTFLCQMWWPAPTTPENPQAGRRLQFNIAFWQLVVQP